MQIKIDTDINNLIKTIGENTSVQSNTDVNGLINVIKDESKSIKDEIATNRAKIHFRYFNLTKSLEGIHHVRINTKNGELQN